MVIWQRGTDVGRRVMEATSATHPHQQATQMAFTLDIKTKHPLTNDKKKIILNFKRIKKQDEETPPQSMKECQRTSFKETGELMRGKTFSACP